MDTGADAFGSKLRNNGRSLDIDHPEFLMFSRSGRTIYVSKPDDTFEIVDLLLVTSLEVLNGQSRSRRKRA